MLGSGDQEHVNNLRLEKNQLAKYVNTLKIYPKIISAYIHFQF